MTPQAWRGPERRRVPRDAGLPGAPDRARAKLLIVDDHPMLRRGLRALLADAPDLEVTAEAATAQAALQAIAEAEPDLAIVDLGLDGSDGMDLIKAIRLRHPRVRVIVLSMHDEATYAERALRAGAQGYVGKQQLGDTVLVAIRRVLAGARYMSDALGATFAARFIDGAAAAGGGPVAALTNRELTVFRLIGQGLATRQIAQSLHLSVKTIEAHREHIKHKLALDSGLALARYATLWASGADGGVALGAAGVDARPAPGSPPTR